MHVRGLSIPCKNGESAHRTFLKTILKSRDISFGLLGLSSFQECHFYILSLFILFNIRKVTRLILTVVILDLNTLGCTNIQTLHPKKYDERPRHF